MIKRCIICNKEFQVSPIERGGRRIGIAHRPKYSFTCKKKCANEYNRQLTNISSSKAHKKRNKLERDRRKIESKRHIEIVGLKDRKVSFLTSGSYKKGAKK